MQSGIITLLKQNDSKENQMITQKQVLKELKRKEMQAMCDSVQGEEEWMDWEFKDGITIALDIHDIEEEGFWHICAYETFYREDGRLDTDIDKPIFNSLRIEDFNDE